MDGMRTMPTQRKSSKEQRKDYHDSHREYFEGVLQLRGADSAQMDCIKAYILANNVRISKQVGHRGGVDFYLTSQKFIQKLSRWIPQRYNCQIRMTCQLHTRDTKLNKDLYRLTLLVQFLMFRIGDIIEVAGEEVRITSMGKKPVGRILSSGKRIFIDVKELQ